MSREFTILIVDDNANIAQNLQDILEAQGYSTALAMDGQTALALCKEKVFGLGLIDIRLPDMSGVELVEKLVSISPEMEYIIITGYASIESAAKAVRHRSIIAYETKPLNIDQLMALVQQVIERKRAEEALRESEQNFRNSIENSPLGIVIIDALGEMVYINQAHLDIYGYSSLEELKAVPIKVRYAPQTWPEVEERIKKRQLGESVANNFQVSIVRKDGGIRHLEIRTSEVLWDGEKRFQYIYRDITERKRMEEALQESEEKYRGIFNNVPTSIILLDKDGQMIDVNPYHIAQIGKGKTTLKDYLGENIVTRPSTVNAALSETYAQLLKGEPFDLEDVYFPITTGGTASYFNVKGVPIFKEGKVVGAIIMYNDITERKHMEEQLQRSQLLASLGEMTAGITHEVGNPLASILLYSEAAMKGDVSRQTRKDLKVIQNEAKRAGKLMRDLLAYSRKLEPKMRRLNLHNVINKVLDMRQYQQKVNNIRTATYLFHVPLYVQGDSSQLTQVFLNLIINAEEAIKESKGKNIEITSRIDGKRARVSIADDGIGIPEEHLDQVFLPFFTTKKVGEGTGLGLSTSYGIIAAHNGLIRAENNEMGGATFIVELPLSDTERQGILPLETKEAST